MDSEGGNEGMKAEIDFVEYFHKPAFHKLFINNLNFYAMRIPTAFADVIEKEVPDIATVHGYSGGYWQIKVVKGEEGISLEDGWEKFREDNNLSPGDVLLLRYFGNWCFHVEIFGLDGLERKMNDFQEEGKPIQHRKINFVCHDKKLKKSQILNGKNISVSGENEEAHHSVPRRKGKKLRKKSMLPSPKKQGPKSYTFVPGKSREKRKFGNQNNCGSSSTFSKSENASVFKQPIWRNIYDAKAFSYEELRAPELERTRRSKRVSRKPAYLKNFVES